MKTFQCRCGNPIFFENTQCVRCGSELGWCPACATLTSLVPGDGGALRCGNDACGTSLVKCHDYAVEQVCNRCCLASEGSARMPLCTACALNRTIPDLSVAGNREKWARLEAGKRHLLYLLDRLGLPYGRDAALPLQFDFKADALPALGWWSLGEQERVYTGHANGVITINVREADPVEREKARVEHREARRTIVGHFRHEIGHYYWQMLVAGEGEPAFVAAFGDPYQPSYEEAQRRHYAEGPPSDWAARHVSAYASMHPWEDFAETFAAYLDMASALDTTWSLGLGELDPASAPFAPMFERYVKLGIVLNEMNRAMGLLDLVPEVFAPPAVAKLEFVHELVRRAASSRPGHVRGAAAA